MFTRKFDERHFSETRTTLYFKSAVQRNMIMSTSLLPDYRLNVLYFATVIKTVIRQKLN